MGRYRGRKHESVRTTWRMKSGWQDSGMLIRAPLGRVKSNF
jgi:hypothetical protein